MPTLLTIVPVNISQGFNRIQNAKLFLACSSHFRVMNIGRLVAIRRAVADADCNGDRRADVEHILGYSRTETPAFQIKNPEVIERPPHFLAHANKTRTPQI